MKNGLDQPSESAFEQANLAQDANMRKVHELQSHWEFWYYKRPAKVIDQRHNDKNSQSANESNSQEAPSIESKPK